MMNFDEGSLVWSRSSPKHKFWPSVVFNTWNAASKAGFVPDGIAYLIEFGRKVDITDAEAAPGKGELLNLYLGDNAEWEFIPSNDSFVLPFLEHRDVFSRQRLGAQMKHQFGPALAAANAILEGKQGAAGGSNGSPSPPQASSKRAGVLLDFGTGTSFSSFAELWNYLLYNGWTTAPGKGLATWYYIPPGSDPKKRNPVLDVDFFTSEQMVINHVRKTGLERPAPVTTVVKKSGRRSSGPASLTRSSSRTSESRSKSAKRSQSTTPVRSKSKRRASLAAAPSVTSTVTISEETTTAAVQPPTKVTAAAPAIAVADKGLRFIRGEKNRCESSSRAEDRATVSAGIDSNGVESVDNGHGKRTGRGIDDGRGELSFTGEDEQKGGSNNGESGSGGSCSQVKETVPESRKDRHARRSGRQEEVHSGSKRSHGRTMQVEATNMSSERGSPNPTGEVSRQTVVARGLVSSPPAPSPSKRPKKRGGVTPTPREMVRLANKQVKHLHGLLAGTERPYPSPYGLDGPISEIAGFMKEAHSAWLARQAGTSGPKSRAKGALIVAGRSGTGKSTAFQAATRLVSTGERNISTFRFVTIKCAKLGGNPNEVFASVLDAVTGPSSTRMEADSALEALSKITELPPFLPILCLENVEKLKPPVLDHLLTMAQEKTLFAVVCLVGSVDIGEEITYNQGCLERECNMVAMLGFKEDKLRAILGQSLGAADPEDKDGEIIASLVNKGALDVIAKTVARVCGSVRIALNVCEVAFVERSRELEQFVEGSQVREAAEVEAADGPSTPYSGGASSAPAAPVPLSPPPFLSSPNGGAGASGVLLTVAGAKSALNRYLVQRPEAVWGGDEAEEQTPP